MVEADESDRSLLKLHPTIAVVTNAELDHHTTYASQRDVDDTFVRSSRRPRQQVVPPDLVRLAERAHGVRRGAGADGQRLELRLRRHPVTLAVPGAHNALNAAAALTAIELAGGDVAAAAEALATFEGAGRRFERLGHDRERRAGRRRLRAPPDRGAGDDRGRAHARTRAAWSPAFSRTCTRARNARRRAFGAALASPTWRWCSTSIRRARARRTSRASPACSWPRRPPTPAAASASPGCAPTPPRRPFCATNCARATCC